MILLAKLQSMRSLMVAIVDKEVRILWEYRVECAWQPDVNAGSYTCILTYRSLKYN